MKKYLLPFFLLISWALTSCSADDDAIADYDQDFSAWTLDGTPAWLEKAFIQLWLDNSDRDGKFTQYTFSSDEHWLQHRIARIHEIDGKQYVSLTQSVGKEWGWISGFDYTVLFCDESSEIRKTGHYDFSTACYTPGGARISSQKLIDKITSDKGSIIFYKGGPFLGCPYSDRVYGLSDIQEWIAPYYRDNLRNLCMERLNKYSDNFFLGTLAFYFVRPNPDSLLKTITDADTDGRGMPFVLMTFTTNDDGSLTRYFESFIATEDGSISPLPLNEITEIAHCLGSVQFDPICNISPIFY